MVNKYLYINILENNLKNVLIIFGYKEVCHNGMQHYCRRTVGRRGKG